MTDLRLKKQPHFLWDLNCNSGSARSITMNNRRLKAKMVNSSNLIKVIRVGWSVNGRHGFHHTTSISSGWTWTTSRWGVCSATSGSSLKALPHVFLEYILRSCYDAIYVSWSLEEACQPRFRSTQRQLCAPTWKSSSGNSTRSRTKFK